MTLSLTLSVALVFIGVVPFVFVGVDICHRRRDLNLSDPWVLDCGVEAAALAEVVDPKKNRRCARASEPFVHFAPNLPQDSPRPHVGGSTPDPHLIVITRHIENSMHIGRSSSSSAG